MKTNIKKPTVPNFNHEGYQVPKIGHLEELRRTVLSCLLWENSFYEDGISVTERIKTLAAKVSPEAVANLAIEAREKNKLRHVPLLLVRELARNPEGRKYVENTLSKVIQRADEFGEFLSLYFSEGKVPLANSVKKGLAKAFEKFNEYNFAKYSNGGEITIRDAMFLSHPKPANKEREELYKRIANNQLATPDTWEVELSAGGGVNKKDSWERLLSENKLGSLALLRNLRNFETNGVSQDLVRNALNKCSVDRVLPYRFISAAKYAPRYENELEELMFKSLNGAEKLPGRTVLMIDKSGSMSGQLSAKSELTRYDAAIGLAILARELCEKVTIYTFNASEQLIPSRRGFSLRDALGKVGGGTKLKYAMEQVNRKESFDRMIIISDEESQDGIGTVNGKTYILNVATYKNGIGYNKNVTHIHGFSENSLKFVCELEKTFDISRM